MFYSRGFIFLLWGILCSESLSAQENTVFPPREPSRLSVRQIHSGHSLTDTYMAHPAPGRLVLATKLRSPVNPRDTIGKSTIPGAPLHWRWSHKSGKPDARVDIGEFELLVTTESVPLRPDPESFQSRTLNDLEKWIKHSWQQGNHGQGAEVMLYSTWVWWQNPEDTKPGGESHIPFRQRLDIEEQRWEKMQDYANEIRPDGMPFIYMIPGHRLMMRIYDDIQTGKAPGLDSIGGIFTDDIHLNSVGSYAVTCLVYAVIYHRNPRELPNQLAVSKDSLSREQALYFKKIAWEVARDYKRAGVP